MHRGPAKSAATASSRSEAGGRGAAASSAAARRDRGLPVPAVGEIGDGSDSGWPSSTTGMSALRSMSLLTAGASSAGQHPGDVHKITSVTLNDL